MTKREHYTCDGCGGIVSIPPYRRLTIEYVRRVHAKSCPSRRATDD